jgi:hypothetical protein
VSSTHASGVHVRHAISRALATSNQRPREATYKVTSARVTLSSSGKVCRAEITLDIRKPRPITSLEPHEMSGWVNPDGKHPMMTLVRLDNPIFVDIHPVTWHSWLPLFENESLPDGIDPFCPKTNPTLEQVQFYAQTMGKRIPTAQELRGLWGEERWPWGSSPDPGKGRIEPPRFEVLPEVGLHPPCRGMFDLGAWLWHMDTNGGLSCGVVNEQAVFDTPMCSDLSPVGFRCVVDP